MSQDIVPYGEHEALSLGRSLTKLGVPSISPGIGRNLFQIADAVKKVIDRPDVPSEVKLVLEGFRLRLVDVCFVAAGQQQEAIEHLERLVKGT